MANISGPSQVPMNTEPHKLSTESQTAPSLASHLTPPEASQGASFASITERCATSSVLSKWAEQSKDAPMQASGFIASCLVGAGGMEGSAKEVVAAALRVIIKK